MERGNKLLLHGDGKHTRRYLFAGDAADAFDTILHMGVIGSVYNVGSMDEFSNLELCTMLLRAFGHDPVNDFQEYVQHTIDRPFNDRRYAVDATKLRRLGWEQKTTFEVGLKITVDWYRQFGEEWWGDIGKVLVPFPVVKDSEIIGEHEDMDESQSVVKGKKSRINGKNGITSAKGGHGYKRSVWG